MIDNTYTLKEIIGFGGSSKVFSAVDASNNAYAIKAIRNDKGYADELASMMVLREYVVMEHIGQHPNIVRHFACNPEGVLSIDNNEQMVCYNAMEHCENGALSTIVKRTGPVEEAIARFMFTQVASAVNFLHSKHFAHLDLKLENILLDKCFNLKVADFGAGVNVKCTKGTTTKKIGTPLYMPPEIKNLKDGESYDALKADIYSLGATLCLLLIGELPDISELQTGTSTADSYNNSSSDDMDVDMNDDDFEKSSWTSISIQSKGTPYSNNTVCIDLLSQMMHPDPDQRPSIIEVLEHEWIQSKEIDGLQEMVYSEMQARIQYIASNSF